MRRLFIPCLVLVLLVNANAGEKKPKAEKPRLTASLQLSVDTYDPNKPDGILTCVVHNRSTEEIRLTAQYDGRTVIIYGHGKTHRGQSNLWRPNRKTQDEQRFMTIDPGKKKNLFEVSLKDILTPPTGGKQRQWAWDWLYRMEPPRTPIHGWRRAGYEERASFITRIQIGEEKLTSDQVILNVKTAA